MKNLIPILILAFAVSSTWARGETDTAEVHFAAHYGLSYAITTVTYGFTKKVFHLDDQDKWQAWVFAFALSTVGGIMRQVLVAPPGVPVNTTGIWQNALGNASAVAVGLTFDF